MNSTPKLSYALIRKKDKIIVYKEQLTKLYRNMMINLLCLAALFLPFTFNNSNYRISLLDSENILPSLRSIDSWIFFLIAITGVCMYVLFGKYKRLRSKYELLRHDIMKDLDANTAASRLCFCHGECECRDNFIQEMEQHGVDLIFKKYKTEQKYPV